MKSKIFLTAIILLIISFSSFISYSITEDEARNYINENSQDPYAYFMLGQTLASQNAQGDYSDALEQFNIALDMGMDYYLLHMTMGRIYFNIGEYDKAIQSFNNALVIRNNDWEIESMILLCEGKEAVNRVNQDVSSYMKIATGYYNLGYFGSAKIILDTIHNIAPGNAEANNLYQQCQAAIRIEDTLRLARNLAAQNMLTNSIDNYDFVIERFKELNHNYKLILIYNERGRVLFDKGMYEEALSDFQSAYNISRQISYFTGILDSLANWGNITFILGYYSRAQELFERVISRLQTEGQLYQVSLFKSSLANVYAARGDLETAINLYTEAGQYLVLVGDPQNVANYYSNFGITLHEAGLYQEAFEKLELAADILLENQNYQYLTLVLSNTGELYQSLGRFDEAEAMFNEALELARESNPAYAYAPLGNLGILYTIEGDLEQAISYLRQSANLANTIGNKRSYSFYLSKLAHAYILSEEYSSAEEALTEAEEVAGSTGNVTIQSSINILLGDLYQKQSDYENASQKYELALSQSESIGFKNGSFQAYFGLGSCAERCDYHIDAADYYKEAVNVLEDMRRNINLSEEEIQEFLNAENRMIVFERLVNLLLEQDDFEQAYQYLERSKMSAIDQGLGYQRPETDNANANDLLDRYEELTMQITALEREMAEADSQEMSMGFLQLKVEAELLLEEVMGAMERDFPDLVDKLSFSQAEDYRVIQDRLSEEDCVIAYCISDEKINFFIITNENFLIRQSHAAKNEIYSRIIDFRRFMNTEDLSLHQTSYQEVQTLLFQLYQILIEPIENEIAPYDNLHIVPYATLFFLPFHALVRQDQDGEMHYLIEDKNITYFSATSFVSLLDDKAPVSEYRVLGIGNPETGRYDLPDLPGAENEVNAISDLFPNSLILTGEDATKSSFFENLPDYNIVHIAAHGVLSSDARRSYLALAGRRGSLYVREITSDCEFAQDIELVVLSACNTAVAEDVESLTGAEYITISGAFLQKVPTLLATLWPLSDESAPVIINTFYNGIQDGLSKEEALSQAQIAVMQNDSFKNPFYWASFILMGDFR